jgi:hypothetical protein
MIPIVTNIPTENTVAIKKALLTWTLPCPSMNPTIRGILDRWHGLNNILKIPQIKEAINAIPGVDSSEVESHSNNVLITIISPDS